MKPPFLRSEYNYDMHEASNASGLNCKDKTRTQQQFKDEADINYIVKRYLVTGELPIHSLPPLNADFEAATDLREVMQLMVEARESFETLDAPIRARFHNNAHEFVEFMENPNNADEVRKMGLYSEEALAAWETKDKAAKAAYAALEADATAYRLEKKEKPTGKPVS